MSENNASGTGVVSTPRQHMSAQLLLTTVTPKRSGFLRKRGKKERLLERFRFVKPIFANLLRWRQKFVILSQGCVYCYASETGNGPLHAFSLQGYNKLTIMESEQSPWAFRITSPHTSSKIHFFACFSDKDRMGWMGAIREEMLAANYLPNDSVSAGSASNSSDAYVYLQRPIFEPQHTTSDPDENSDDDNPNDDYDQIDDEELDRIRRERKSLPALPTSDPPKRPPERKGVTLPTPIKPDKPKKVTINNGTESTKPQKPAKPEKPAKPKTRKLSEDEYYFPDSDREKALEILREQDAGSYLVRKSRTNDNKVLAVKTVNRDIKEYKILLKDQKFTLNNREFYKSVEDLLTEYQRKPLPDKATTLVRPYGSTMNLSM